MSDVTETTSRRRGFEVTDANPRAIFLAGLALLALLVATLAGVALIYRHRLYPKSGGPAVDFREGAARRTSIEESWSGLDAETAARLSGYRWIDKRAGVVQIPIGRAMEALSGKEAER